MQVPRQHADLGEEVGRQLVDLQSEEVFHLRQPDQHCDAVGESDDDGHRDVAHQRAQLEQAQQKQQYPRQRGGNQQVGQPVAFDDAVDDDDEGTGRAADLHMRAAQRRNQQAGDDGGEDALFGIDARGDGEGHGQWERNDADGDAGADVGRQVAAVVVLQRVKQPRAERMQ